MKFAISKEVRKVPGWTPVRLMTFLLGSSWSPSVCIGFLWVSSFLLQYSPKTGIFRAIGNSKLPLGMGINVYGVRVCVFICVMCVTFYLVILHLLS